MARTSALVLAAKFKIIPVSSEVPYVTVELKLGGARCANYFYFIFFEAHDFGRADTLSDTQIASRIWCPDAASNYHSWRDLG